MATTNSDYHTIGGAGAVTFSNRGSDRRAERPLDLPGIVIFIHGVNDPGAVYSIVEEGLCKGLNERLSRNDLRPGSYGAEYKEAKSNKKPGKVDTEILRDPDSNLYRRVEVSGSTNSSFIPFYWGYRASNNEIAKIGNAGDVHGRIADDKGNLMTRGQYQDIHGNRLDPHFGKGGGFFANATNNIPDMYGAGFRADWKAEAVTRTAAGGNSMYAADAPDRTYYVLAATRLANLISLIRAVKPSEIASAHGMLPEHETITVMGHSQGTILTLLAQAILRQRGERCVDCMIMVDSPYSLYETKDCTQTGHAKLTTLIDIVNEVTQKPYEIPKLAEMLTGEDKLGGRAGVGWTPDNGKRVDQSGKNWVTFDERDNRGKVYLYFCPEDTVVGLTSVHGIGTFGVPEYVPADGAALRGNQKTKSIEAMAVLSKKRFFQRMWTRMERNHKKVLVGTAPARVPVRENLERRSPGPENGASNLLTNLFLQESFENNDIRNINAEELKPPCEPRMYGGEAVIGGPKPGEGDRAGLMIPDDVTKDVILGNQYAHLEWIFVETCSPFTDIEKEKAEFNAGRPTDEQSHNWRVTGFEGMNLEREETPKEARERMQSDEDALEVNNYHSGMLHDAENHRWVSAMDMALGQAVTMDDRNWHELIILLADWKLTPRAYQDVTNCAAYPRLPESTQAFIEACADYYQNGVFPAEKFVSMTAPPLVTSEFTAEIADAQAQAEMKFRQGQAAAAMANMGSVKW